MNKYIKPILIFLTISLAIIACNNIARVDRQSLQTDAPPITKSSTENNVLKILFSRYFEDCYPV
ncbi:MAG: hypothetical protein QNJ41_08240 [Xenococcaceae cyanobacterium MO_188.B32]|nr:hypothetical protein [Xenococcaceae cyanobacterium MO_188.B32]